MDNSGRKDYFFVIIGGISSIIGLIISFGIWLPNENNFNIECISFGNFAIGGWLFFIGVSICLFFYKQYLRDIYENVNKNKQMSYEQSLDLKQIKNMMWMNYLLSIIMFLSAYGYLLKKIL